MIFEAAIWETEEREKRRVEFEICREIQRAFERAFDRRLYLENVETASNLIDWLL
jgi:hypothetical protein